MLYNNVIMKRIQAIFPGGDSSFGNALYIGKKQIDHLCPLLCEVIPDANIIKILSNLSGISTTMWCFIRIFIYCF